MSGPLYKWAVMGAQAEHPFCDAALLEAMLRFEVALAQAQARLGLIPEGSAAAIAQYAGSAVLEPSELARAGAEAGSLAIPFIQTLIAHVAGHDAAAGRYIHFGATSQDLLDTALALCARKAVSTLEQDLQRACRAAAGLARLHTGTPILARTLLQPAAVTTVGFKCAQWALSLARTRRRLLDTATGSLAVSLGGAVGNLAAYAEAGPALRSWPVRSACATLVQAGIRSARTGWRSPPIARSLAARWVRSRATSR
jgi:3-carboxy-cis,cis-muconate cycloisomerase